VGTCITNKTGDKKGEKIRKMKIRPGKNRISYREVEKLDPQ
jgi:hypothetical protein